jgi:hypothetical protein
MVVKELAKALGPHGIRVNAIAPGAVPGGGFDASGAGIERLTRCTSLRRLGTPEEIAGMAGALTDHFPPTLPVRRSSSMVDCPAQLDRYSALARAASDGNLMHPDRNASSAADILRVRAHRDLLRHRRPHFCVGFNPSRRPA